MSAPPVPAPDEKDWTWVLDRPCPECGFDATAFDRSAIGATVRAGATTFGTSLARPDARERPQPTVWSVLEYGAHVRDVFTLYAERLQLMLDSGNGSGDDRTAPCSRSTRSAATSCTTWSTTSTTSALASARPQVRGS